MSDVQVFQSADGTVRIEGLRTLQRRLSRAGIDSSDLTNTMRQIAQAVINVAHPPILTGTLKSTLRAGKGKTKAVVRAGSAKVPYAGVIEYGWAAHGIAPTHWLSDARDSRSAESKRLIQKGIENVLKQNDLT